MYRIPVQHEKFLLEEFHYMKTAVNGKKAAQVKAQDRNDSGGWYGQILKRENGEW